MKLSSDPIFIHEALRALSGFADLPSGHEWSEGVQNLGYFLEAASNLDINDQQMILRKLWVQAEELPEKAQRYLPETLEDIAIFYAATVVHRNKDKSLVRDMVVRWGQDILLDFQETLAEPSPYERDFQEGTIDPSVTEEYSDDDSPWVDDSFWELQEDPVQEDNYWQEAREYLQSALPAEANVEIVTPGGESFQTRVRTDELVAEINKKDPDLGQMLSLSLASGKSTSLNSPIVSLLPARGGDLPWLVLHWSRVNVDSINKQVWDSARGGDWLYYTQVRTFVLIGGKEENLPAHDTLGYLITEMVAGKGWMHKVGNGWRNLRVEIQYVGEKNPLEAYLRHKMGSRRKPVPMSLGR